MTTQDGSTQRGRGLIGVSAEASASADRPTTWLSGTLLWYVNRELKKLEMRIRTVSLVTDQCIRYFSSHWPVRLAGRGFLIRVHAAASGRGLNGSGQDIYSQGDAGDTFYTVVRGTVSISTLNAAQQAICLVPAIEIDKPSKGQPCGQREPRGLRAVNTFTSSKGEERWTTLSCAAQVRFSPA